MNVRISLIGLTAFFGLMLGCQPSKNDSNTQVLATLGSDEITVADLDNYLVGLPEKDRWMQAGDVFETWVEDKIRMLAIQQHFANSDATREFMASDKASEQQLLAYTQTLTKVLNQALTQQVVLDENLVDARLAEMKANRNVEPILNFQHVYLRSDTGDKSKILAKAKKLAAEAKSGADFTALVRAHSDSSNAQEGGIVQNVKPSDLDPKSAEILGSLAEGEISDLIESRTGYHIFRLMRRIQVDANSDTQLRQSAEAQLKQQVFAENKVALLQYLRTNTPTDTNQDTWQIGTFKVTAGFRQMLRVREGDDQVKAQLVDHFLLAQEAIERDLVPQDLDATVQKQIQTGFLEQLFNEARRSHDETIDETELRHFYNAQATLFTLPERFKLQLIFVPKGGDSFSTQKRLEKEVEKLRNGASFEDLARNISIGPEAANGGLLGPHTVQEWAGYNPILGNKIPDMPIGSISDPLFFTDRVLSSSSQLLRGGFAIVKMVEKFPEREQPFEEALAQVRSAYASKNRASLDLQIRDAILSEASFHIQRLPAKSELVR